MKFLINIAMFDNAIIIIINTNSIFNRSINYFKLIIYNFNDICWFYIDSLIMIDR